MLKNQIPVSNKKDLNSKAPAAPSGNVGNAKITKPQKPIQDEEEILEVFEEGGGIKKGSFLGNLLVRAAILTFINLIGIAGIVYFDRKIPTKAEEIKTLRSEKLAISAQNLEIIKSDVEEHKLKADKLIAFFPDDTGLVNFVNELDKIKKEGKITGFSFAAESAIKDKTGTIGIPVLIEFKGTWSEIDADLQKIQSLPYILRAIEVEAELAEEEGLIDLRFGGFLYVGKDFGKN